MLWGLEEFLTKFTKWCEVCTNFHSQSKHVGEIAFLSKTHWLYLPRLRGFPFIKCSPPAKHIQDQYLEPTNQIHDQLMSNFTFNQIHMFTTTLLLLVRTQMHMGLMVKHFTVFHEHLTNISQLFTNIWQTFHSFSQTSDKHFTNISQPFKNISQTFHSFSTNI